jgi:hypothetical protein
MRATPTKFFYPLYEMLSTAGDVLFQYELKGEPKSGTTWLEFIIDRIIEHGCDDVKSCTYKKTGRNYVAHFDDANDVEFLPDSNKHKIPSIGHSGGFDFSEAPNLTDEQIRDAALQLLPHVGPNRGWIAIFRDPRAVLVSSCHHLRKQDCDGFAQYNFRASVAWIDLRYRFFRAFQPLSSTQVEIVSFEGLKHHFERNVRHIAAFMGISLGDDSVTAIKNETSITTMHTMEEHGQVPKGGAPVKVLTGETCSYKDELQDATMAAISHHMESSMSVELQAMFQC